MKPSALRVSFDTTTNTTTATTTNINGGNTNGNWTPRSSNDWANKTLSPPPPPPPIIRSSASASASASAAVLSSSQSFKSSNTKPINRNADSSNDKKEIVKRPFLKKGSRKEPSAIHRVTGRDVSSSPINSNDTSNNNNNTATSTTTKTTTTNGRPQVSRSHITKSYQSNDDFEHEVHVKGNNYYRPTSNPSPINTSSYTSTYSKNHMETLTYDDNNTSILNEGISLQLRLKQTTALQELDEFAMLEKELETMNDTTPHPFYDNTNKNDDDDGDSNTNNEQLFTRTGTYSSDRPLLGTTTTKFSSSSSSSSPFKYSGTSAFQENSHTTSYSDKNGPNNNYDDDDDDDYNDYNDNKNDIVDNGDDDDDLYGTYKSNTYQKYTNDDDDDDDDDDLILPTKQSSRSIETSSFTKAATQSIDSSMRKSNTGSATTTATNSTWGAVSRPDIKALVSSSFYRDENDNKSPKASSNVQKGSTHPSRGSVRGSLTKGPKGQEAHQDADALQSTLKEKAKELELELSTYKEENATLKQLRKQQEAALAEIVQQRTELIKWINEEKQKTEAFCEEQKQGAIRERRAAAKLARDSRQKALAGGVGNVPIRKEREEIDALKATIEKLKVDIDNINKKAKMNERRLSQMLKDSQEESDNLNQRILGLENEKVTLWEYLDQEGIRIPSNISRGRPKKKAAPKPTYGEYDSYVEEVDIDYVTSAHVVSSYVKGHGTKNSQQEMDMMSSQDSSHFSDNKRLHRNKTPQYSDEATRGDSKKYSATYNSIQQQSSSSSSSSKLNKTSFDLNTNVLESWNSKGSKSSRGSRYSSGDDDADSDIYASIEKSTTHNIIEQENNTSDLKQLSTNNYSKTFGSTHSRDAASSVAIGNTISNKTDDNVNYNTNNNTRPEECFPDGRKIIKYRNGTTKEVFPNGSSIVRFANGDRKHSDNNTGLIVYFYAEAQTKHTTFPDGTEVYEFPNKQIERHFANGLKEILFPDKTKKLIYPDGTHESIFPDGVLVRETADGQKTVVSK